MADYIDGYAFPIAQAHLDTYKNVAEKIASIWKEYGATAYMEFLGDHLKIEGTCSFVEGLQAEKDEAIIFGWVAFESKASRDIAHKKVAADTRMAELVKPIMDPSRLIFSPGRMFCGGFQSFIKA